MEQITYSPQCFYKMVQHYKEAQLLFAAIELDVFSHLEGFIHFKTVASKTGCHERNLRLFLNGLVAIGLIEKQGDNYKNTPVVDCYLNKNRDLYLGEYILFREEMTALTHVRERVKNGPVQETAKHNKGVETYDFYKLAKLTVKEMYAGRVQSFLKALKCLFNGEETLKILDLGGGPGIMAIEFVKQYPRALGVVFEHPSVSPLPKTLAEEMGLEDRMEVLSGDFTIDEIGKGYDIIIASGVLDFAKGSLDNMVAKLYHALKPCGYLYLVSHDVNEDHTAPKESIVGWLSGHLEGLDVLLDKKSVCNALESGGFKELDKTDIKGMMESLRGEIYIKG